MKYNRENKSVHIGFMLFGSNPCALLPMLSHSGSASVKECL